MEIFCHDTGIAAGSALFCTAGGTTIHRRSGARSLGHTPGLVARHPTAACGVHGLGGQRGGTAGKYRGCTTGERPAACKSQVVTGCLHGMVHSVGTSVVLMCVPAACVMPFGVLDHRASGRHTSQVAVSVELHACRQTAGGRIRLGHELHLGKWGGGVASLLYGCVQPRDLWWALIQLLTAWARAGSTMLPRAYQSWQQQQ